MTTIQDDPRTTLTSDRPEPAGSPSAAGMAHRRRTTVVIAAAVLGLSAVGAATIVGRSIDDEPPARPSTANDVLFADRTVPASPPPAPLDLGQMERSAPPSPFVPSSDAADPPLFW